MRATDRRSAAPLIDQLLGAPHGFEFVQAVSILLAWLGARGVPFEQALAHCLRFENSLQLVFPAAEIEAIGFAAPARDGEPAPTFTLTATFMGLLGVQGSLPLHLTERIAAWQSAHDDPAPRAFLDLLSNRLLALFYGAWRKHRLACLASAACASAGAGTGTSDRYAPLLQALAGAGPDLVPAAGTPPALLLASCAGLLQQRPRSAAMLVRVLNAYFGVPIALEQNVGYWDRLAPHEQGALGANAVLGDNVLLGERSWRPDLRARLAIGPLDAAAYASFLPHAAAGAALGAILRRCAEPGVHFEVQLILRAQDVQPLQLAAHGSGARLGRDCFLVHGAVGAHRADLRYLLATTTP